MDLSEMNHLAQTLRGELRFKEPMARHVTWRAGGAAARAYVPADLDDLAAFLRATRIDEPLLFVERFLVDHFCHGAPVCKGKAPVRRRRSSAWSGSVCIRRGRAVRRSAAR